ncbi:E3 SUMO-protein ligase ZBED1-like [Myxocyprinus asiaticus]|uniref:E3 SUMO-protein ligase ZBED1-like n=1 Tax=Myxocyprinus asiaticus TaxID=70543 RepID=UPI0022232D90|nr:E3 SUMO-protein ligase ZBED1-like [Myxocyprinus asiaticus]XP_051546387.1 E3 SUMO-protein ligase ZBED1-like [Myxocyprinus asiaticus]
MFTLLPAWEEGQKVLSLRFRLRSENDLCTLTEADIRVAEDIMKALRPMKAATLTMSGESATTLSVIAPLHAQLLEEMRQTTSDSTVIKELKSAMHNDLRFRYANLKEKLHVASALDPRFKTLPFISDEDREDTFTRLISETDHSGAS